jgi:hypothetical protein
VAGDGAKRTTRARAKTKASRSAKPPRRQKLRDFYRSALSEAEQIQLEAAAELEGVDDEIAVLRMKLREALQKQPDDLQLMLRGVDLLVKAVSARYKLSPEAGEDLADSIAGVVRGVGGLLMPEAFADEQA